MAIRWMDAIAIIGEGNSVITSGSASVSLSSSNMHSTVRFKTAGIIITIERVLGTQPSLSINISSSSDSLSQLCGLCGDRRDNLRLRNGQRVNPTNQQEVEMLAADFRVQSSNQLFQITRQECGKHLVLCY